MLIRSQNKEDATELLAQKAELETKKKELEEAAVAKEVQRDRKIRTIGNYVHESVPVSNDEVWVFKSPGDGMRRETDKRISGYRQTTS